MKKAIKIIVPILMAIVIIVCIGWYLFVYDRDFARDMLLSAARHFEGQNNTSVAAWFYDRAYEYGNESDAVALELADQYVQSGSYTKAEQTLYRAIRDGGSADVYIALSRLFVAQDKLIDAVRLLDDIQDPQIKAELDAKRPTAPVSLQEQGTYNQYISITLTAVNGTIYANPNGEFPTVQKDLYASPIQLQAGENRIYAVTVGNNGLVSPLAILQYTVGDIVQELVFSDAAIEAAVRKTLNVATNTIVYTNDLWTIRDFTIPTDAQNYQDLQHMLFLEKLIIHDGKSGQLDFLKKLKTLQQLEIGNTSVSNEELELIGMLSNLQSLTLDNCNLTTISDLSGNSNLLYLNLSNNTIRNIQSISKMTELKELYLEKNALTDLSALSSCALLEILDVSHNSLTSINPIGGLIKLRWLDVGGNEVSNINSISKLTSLEYLDLNSNLLTDISAVSACSNLDRLNISSNNITDIGSLSVLKKLTVLDFSHNAVTVLPKWNIGCALVTIDGSYNQLSDLSPLSGLRSLNNVLMDYNEKIDSVDSLVDCPVLFQVNVYGTAVKDASSLTDKDIAVNYNPLQD